MKAYLAEAVGTFALIFVGIGAIQSAGSDLLAVALAHGLTIAVMVSATAAVSGGHLNPAVSFGLWTAGKLPLDQMLRYWAAQLVGAVLAALLASWLFSQVTVAGGTPTITQYSSFGQGVILEAITTFFLVFTVFGTAVDPRAPKIGGLAIGLAVTIGILVAGPFTGGALNPARAFGPELVTGTLFQQQSLVYWIGPLLGGGLAGWLYSRYMMDTR